MAKAETMFTRLCAFDKKSAETNLVTSIVSPICKVTSKTAIQHNISPFIYLHVRHETNSSPGMVTE